MTQTLPTSASTTTAGTPQHDAAPPSPPHARSLLLAGSVAGPLFLGLGVIQGMTRAGFSFTRNAISQLSLGGLGWIQVTSFLLTGLLVIGAAVGLRRALAGSPGGRWAPRLIAVFGLSFLAAAIFKADAGAGFPAGTPTGPGSGLLSWHGGLHMLSGMVGYLALCAAFLVLARHFATEGSRSWAWACRLVPIAVLAGFAASGTAVLFFTLGAGLGLLWLTAVTAQLAAKN